MQGVGIAACMCAILVLSSCSKMFPTGGSTLDADSADKGLGTKDPYGQLYSSVGWLGKVRVFYDPVNEYGLVFYWMPRIEKLQTGKGVKDHYCTTEDGFQYDASWNVPLTIAMYDTTHNWQNPIAEFYPESEFFPQVDQERAYQFSDKSCDRPIESENPRPCSAFPLYDPNFENRRNFKYHNIAVGSKLVVLVSQPTLRAGEIGKQLGYKNMFVEMPSVGVIPHCLTPQPASPDFQRVTDLLYKEYLYPADLEAGGEPVFRFTFNIYNQLLGCQQWYAAVGLVPIEINISQDAIAPLPDDLRGLSYHPDASGSLCEVMSQVGGT